MNPFVNGATFVLDASTHVPAIWGDGNEVLWAAGEALMIVGPDGVGKSTLAQQLILARLGIRDHDVLGYTVTADPDHRVLYVASDRPNQIARSIRRMVSEHDRHFLEDRLVVWPGPLPFDVAEKPEELLALAKRANARTVFIDSWKDVAMALSEDRVGSAVNRAVQRLIAEGIEVAGTHHPRKATAENRKPTKLSDVYGSRWLTAGHGSVVLLWAEAGDPVVELTHIKQPAEVVGPLEMIHDHGTGTTTALERSTVHNLIGEATNGGITVREFARRLYGSDPDRSRVEKARRKLDDLVRQNIATKVYGDTPKAPARYFATAPTVIVRDSPRDRSRCDHAASRTVVERHHAPITADHATSPDLPHPFKGEGRDGSDVERERLGDTTGTPKQSTLPIPLSGYPAPANDFEQREHAFVAELIAAFDATEIERARDDYDLIDPRRATA